MSLRAIIPKAVIGNATPAIQAGLRRWQADVVSKMAKYPPQQAHTKYRRTGTYGRNWQMELALGSAVVYNEVKYAKYLGGYLNERARWAGPYGWKQIVEVGFEAADAMKLDKVIRDALVDAIEFHST